jgi:hypothetical protein
MEALVQQVLPVSEMIAVGALNSVFLLRAPCTWEAR